MRQCTSPSSFLQSLNDKEFNIATILSYIESKLIEATVRKSKKKDAADKCLRLNANKYARIDSHPDGRLA